MGVGGTFDVDFTPHTALLLSPFLPLFAVDRAMSPAQSEDSGLAPERGTTYATITLPRNALHLAINFAGKRISLNFLAKNSLRIRNPAVPYDIIMKAPPPSQPIQLIIFRAQCVFLKWIGKCDLKQQPAYYAKKKEKRKKNISSQLRQLSEGINID